MTSEREGLASEEKVLIEEYWKVLRTLPSCSSLNSRQFQAMPAPTNEAESQRVKDKMDVSNLINHDEYPVEPAINNHTLSNPWALLDISNNAPEARHGKVPAGFPDCILCPQRFELHSKLAEHLILDHGYPEPKCPHCNFKCAKIVRMKRHVKYAHDMVVGKYHCFTCEYSSNSELTMKNHTRNTHSRCPYCQKGFERLGTHERGCAMHPKHTYMTEYFKQHDRRPPK